MTEFRPDRLDGALTGVAAGLATVVAADGMWQVFAERIPGPVWLRAVMFSTFEVAMLAEAVRARNAVRAGRPAGLDGAAVYIIAGISAGVATLVTASTAEAAVRLAAPLLAAWLWHRALRVERIKVAEGRGTTIAWRWTAERLLVRLGLADAAERSTGDVAAHRLIVRVAHAARRARSAAEGTRRRRLADWRLARAVDAAVERAGIATDPDRQEQLRATVATVFGASRLLHLDDAPPWETRRPAPPRRPAAAAEDVGARGDRPSKLEFAQRLAEQIRADPTWQPDYEALIADTGYGQRWCEYRVTEARQLASRPHLVTDEASSAVAR